MIVGGGDADLETIDLGFELISDIVAVVGARWRGGQRHIAPSSASAVASVGPIREILPLMPFSMKFPLCAPLKRPRTKR